jgi:hypothetical protein
LKGNPAIRCGSSCGERLSAVLVGDQRTVAVVGKIIKEFAEEFPLPGAVARNPRRPMAPLVGRCLTRSPSRLFEVRTWCLS